MTLLLLKGYRRELSARVGESARNPRRELIMPGTVLDSRRARSRACARIYGVLSRKSLTSTWQPEGPASPGNAALPPR